MIVICACGAKLKINDEKITVAGVKIKCPKCGNPHLVKKTAPATPVPKADELSMPWFASSTPSAAQPLILIAHDSTVVADMIEQVVRVEGYVTAHAPDGLEALKKAIDLKPRVMIVDVGLTGIYGFELCERLKGDPDTRDIKIILLSSVYGLTAYKRLPVTLYGADDYIEKHHIPDRLVSKIKRLLSGEPLDTPQPSPVSEPAPAVHDHTEQKQDSHTSSPLKRRKGLTFDSSPSTGAMKSPEAPAVPTAGQKEKPLVLPKAPDVMPKAPVTLDDGRKRTIPPLTPGAAVHPPKAEVMMPEKVLPPTAAIAVPASTKANAKVAALQDETVMLDSSFFEHEEYVATVRSITKTTADPEEIEKARRFARLIVSDIALYNQDVVAEGLRKGTFFELLQDDITEGRSLYNNRVPESIRTTKDYYQEAFDEFIATKKKQR